MKRLVPVAVCLFLCLCAGCAGVNGKKQGATAPTEEKKPEHREVGTIVMVNEAQKFVLIDLGAYSPPTDGTALKCFSNGKETGVLTMSPERRPPFMIGNIVSGTPQEGDEVRE